MTGSTEGDELLADDSLPPGGALDMDGLAAELPADARVRGAAELQALVAGIAAAPHDPTRAWAELIAPDLSADLVARLAAVIQSLRPPPLAPDPGRLDRLRQELARRGLDGFVIPRADEYQGEYVPAQAERLAWLTGFTGSAGYAVVTQRHAVLFVDGRYTLQADAQAKPLGFEVCHQATCPFDQWLADVLEPRQRLGFDPWLHTVGWLEKTRKTCEDLGAELVGVTDNPIDALWTGRPLAPLGAVLPHPVDYAGEPPHAGQPPCAG
ncbi:MAG: aminopeptidase P family N-terminal domain-containing protein [Rhodospirillaceae bacterium]|nr:aminopeptidase P family N-terminal domain-containing protein [Rhodospirillaceae bacterium]